jgi:hypothetical protein
MSITKPTLDNDNITFTCMVGVGVGRDINAAMMMYVTHGCPFTFPKDSVNLLDILKQSVQLRWKTSKQLDCYAYTYLEYVSGEKYKRRTKLNVETNEDLNKVIKYVEGNLPFQKGPCLYFHYISEELEESSPPEVPEFVPVI